MEGGEEEPVDDGGSGAGGSLGEDTRDAPAGAGSAGPPPAKRRSLLVTYYVNGEPRTIHMARLCALLNSLPKLSADKQLRVVSARRGA